MDPTPTPHTHTHTTHPEALQLVVVLQPPALEPLPVLLTELVEARLDAWDALVP